MILPFYAIDVRIFLFLFFILQLCIDSWLRLITSGSIHGISMCGHIINGGGQIGTCTSCRRTIAAVQYTETAAKASSHGVVV